MSRNAKFLKKAYYDSVRNLSIASLKLIEGPQLRAEVLKSSKLIKARRLYCACVERQNS